MEKRFQNLPLKFNLHRYTGGNAAGGPTALDDGYSGAGDDPFALELAGLGALTRITAELDAKELCAEKGVLDRVVAILAADYYHGGAGAGAGAEGDVPVPPPLGSGWGCTSRIQFTRRLKTPCFNP